MSPVELAQARGGQVGRQAAQKRDPLQRLPAAGVDRRAGGGEGARGVGDRGRQRRGRRSGVGGDVEALEPGRQHRLELAAERRPDVDDEGGGVRRAERQTVEAGAEELVEAGAAEALLQRAQQQRALLVGDLGHRAAGVVTRAELLVELGAEPVVSEARDLGVEIDPAGVPQQIGHGGAAQALHDAALDVGGDALVEPHRAPGRVGDQVARPRVRELVRDQRHHRAIAGDHRRREERQARILHAAHREARRQHQQVVAAPAVGTVELLGRRHHRVDLDELGGRGVDQRRLGIDPGVDADGAEREVADRERDQVRRDRLRHAEPVGAVGGAGLRVLGAHQRDQVGRHVHHRVVGEAHAGAVLRRQPAPAIDRLRLREQHRVDPAARAGRRHPQQRARARRGLVLDLDAADRGRHGDRQRRAEQRVGRAERVRQRWPAAAAGPGRDDLEALGVEDQVGAGDLAVEGVRRGAAQPLAVEVDGELEREVRDRGLVRLRRRVRIVGHPGRRRRCRDRRGQGPRRLPAAGAHASEDHERRDESDGGAAHHDTMSHMRCTVHRRTSIGAGRAGE